MRAKHFSLSWCQVWSISLSVSAFIGLHKESFALILRNSTKNFTIWRWPCSTANNTGFQCCLHYCTTDSPLSLTYSCDALFAWKPLTPMTSLEESSLRENTAAMSISRFPCCAYFIRSYSSWKECHEYRYNISALIICLHLSLLDILFQSALFVRMQLENTE